MTNETAAPATAEATVETSTAVKFGETLVPLTVEQAFDVLVEWKSVLHVYGAPDPLITAFAYYSEADEAGARRFWRSTQEAVQKAKKLKEGLDVFIAAAERFQAPRPF